MHKFKTILTIEAFAFLAAIGAGCSSDHYDDRYIYEPAGALRDDRAPEDEWTRTNSAGRYDRRHQWDNPHFEDYERRHQWDNPHFENP